MKICEVCGAPSGVRCYRKCPFYKPALKWKKPQWGMQKTHCGRYFVDRSENGGWNSYGPGDDFPITDDQFDTRSEAKDVCEEEADRKLREQEMQAGVQAKISASTKPM